MQDPYAVDVGDYAKYGLLRWLCGVTSGGNPLTLGVAWYYVRTVGQLPPMGQTYNYILNPGKKELTLPDCDQELFQILESIVRNNRRSVAEIEGSGVLPQDTVFFRDTVTRPGRDEWFKRAMDAVRGCVLVFLDPDIGLADQPDPEHATYDEAAQLWRMGKSLVIYQSFNRDVSHEEQMLSHAQRLRKALGIDGPAGEIIALRFGRLPPRVFFVIPNPANREVARLLRERVDSFMASCWGDHFTRVDC